MKRRHLESERILEIEYAGWTVRIWQTLDFPEGATRTPTGTAMNSELVDALRAVITGPYPSDLDERQWKWDRLYALCAEVTEVAAFSLGCELGLGRLSTVYYTKPFREA